MNIKADDVLVYKDSQMATRYGTGVVTSVTPDEYTVLWSGRGATKYRRQILDSRWRQIFDKVEGTAGSPKQRHLQLGTAKVRVAFNENYDRAKLASLCEKLKSSDAENAKEVAIGLAAELFTKKLVLRGQAKAVLSQLADLCETDGAVGSDEARDISRELFFGYVLKKSDFQVIERGDR